MVIFGIDFGDRRMGISICDREERMAVSVGTVQVKGAKDAAKKAAKEYSSLTPPAHILNAPTKMMKNLGYSKGYIYDHDTPEGFSGQNYFPEAMGRKKFYKPVERGFEREIARRLAYWENLRNKKNG